MICSISKEDLFIQMAIATKVNDNLVKLKVSVNLYIMKGLYTKGLESKTLNRVKEKNSGLMEKDMKDIILKAKSMDMENFIGVTVHIIRDSL